MDAHDALTDKLPNTTTTSTTTPTPVTTTTTTRYLAPYTAATQATKQTTAESVISAKVQSMNLSNPIWIAVFVMAGLGVVVLGACIATLVYIFMKKKKARVMSEFLEGDTVGIEMTETGEGEIEVSETETVVLTEERGESQLRDAEDLL